MPCHWWRSKVSLWESVFSLDHAFSRDLPPDWPQAPFPVEPSWAPHLIQHYPRYRPTWTEHINAPWCPCPRQGSRTFPSWPAVWLNTRMWVQHGQLGAKLWEIRIQKEKCLCSERVMERLLLTDTGIIFSWTQRIVQSHAFLQQFVPFSWAKVGKKSHICPSNCCILGQAETRQKALLVPKPKHLTSTPQWIELKKEGQRSGGGYCLSVGPWFRSHSPCSNNLGKAKEHEDGFLALPVGHTEMMMGPTNRLFLGNPAAAYEL